MKVLYISSPFFFDVDLSLIRSLSKKVELVYLLDLPKHGLKQTALNIDEQFHESGIFRATIYPEFKIYKDYLTCETFIINRPISKLFSRESILLYPLIKKFINEQNPDIVHYNDFANLGILPTLLNHYNKIMTIHDPLPHIGSDTWLNRLKRWINFKLVKKYILLNTSQQVEFSKTYKIPLDNIFLSRLGVFEFYRENHIDLKNVSNHNLSILFFGRITPYKGLDVLLEAFERVLKEIPDAKLVIAGKGDFSFNKFTLRNVTVLNRFIPNEELFDLISKSSFVVCPYIEATQSGVIMTSFSLQKPVLATRVGGLAEMVEHNFTGLICEPNNSTILCDSILILLRNPDKLIIFSKKIESDYYKDGKNGWGSITNEICEIYSSISETKSSK